MNSKHRGTTLDSLLEELGELQEVKIMAEKKIEEMAHTHYRCPTCHWLLPLNEGRLIKHYAPNGIDTCPGSGQISDEPAPKL